MRKMKPKEINGKPLSPVHYSEQNGVHADLGHGAGKTHIPYNGQTTIDTFRSGRTMKQGFQNDQKLANLGGKLDCTNL